MKRIIFALVAGLFFSGSLFAENDKFDEALNRKIKDHGKSSTVNVRVIVQRSAPPTELDTADLRKYGTVKRELKKLNGTVVELPIAQLQRLASNPTVSRISIDHEINGNAAEPRAVSGAAQAARKYSVYGTGVGVAVIDSGIAAHRDLPNVVKAVDFVEPARTGGVDTFGHGTHIAGIIGGSGVSSGGAYTGIAPGVHLVDLRVLDQNGSGYTSDVIAAVEWVIDNRYATATNGRTMNIRVINLSLGHRPYESTATDPLTSICRIAVKEGIVVVASAGNYGLDAGGKTVHGGIFSPGNEPAVITVGAMSMFGTESRLDDKVAAYSSRGPTMVENLIKPDIAAPGSQIIGAASAGSTLAMNYPNLRIGSNYIRLSGTSMAAGVVSGAVALMLQENPSLTPNAVKAALMYTAEHRVETPLAVGAGYINVMGAVNLAANIDTSVLAGRYWILHAGLGLTYSDYFAGSVSVWGQTIVWSDALYSSNGILYNESAWGQTIVWGIDMTDWATTIVWETNAFVETEFIEGQTIVWEMLDGLTVAWESP